jgi:membrane-bound lytic murein transglycosylase D
MRLLFERGSFLGFTSKIIGQTAACVAVAATLGFSGCDQPASPSSAQAKAPATATAPALAGSGQPSGGGTGIAAAGGRAANSKTAPDSHSGPNAQAGYSQQSAQSKAAQVAQLISQADAAYASGLEHFRAKQMDLARADFDRAVDVLLTSPLDIRNTPELSTEFDKIVDGVNTLETAALEQGEGITRQTEISPGEEANDVTFPVDPNLRAKAEADLKTTRSDLPLVINDAVASYISYFTNNRDGRAHLQRSFERAGRYREMITRILREEGVPQDLIYQAVAESGFQALAVNGHSGAGGMWQFMPSTGALYGLQRNAYLDDRFDPEKATRAYARFMKDLYAQLGDWYLVMAGYDWGPGGVQHAVQKTGYADFWELYRRNNLPKETKNYVPIILAAVIIAKNPAQYGFTSLNLEPPLIFDTVPTESSISLRLVADLTGSQLEDIVTLNPGLLRLVTPAAQSYNLRVPPGTKDLFATRLAQIPEDRRDAWRFHVVAAGESLTEIAHTYHADASQIASLNHISGDTFEEGQGLVIPVAAVAASTHAVTHYTTRKGDTVVSVSDRFGVTQAQLRTWNHLKGNAVPPGKVLRVASTARATPRAHKGGKSSGGKAGASSGKSGTHGTMKSKTGSAAKGGSSKSGASKTGSGKAGSSKAGSGKTAAKKTTHAATGSGSTSSNKKKSSSGI